MLKDISGGSTQMDLGGANMSSLKGGTIQWYDPNVDRPTRSHSEPKYGLEMWSPLVLPAPCQWHKNHSTPKIE
jgi:hypothetical protein